MSAHASDVNEQNFDETVLKSEKPVVVDFWAPWCGPCKMLKPMLEKLAEEQDGRFLLARLNSDENQALARRYNVRSIPDVRVFVKGEVVDGFTGALPESALRAFLEKAIPSPAEELRRKAQNSDPESARKLLMEALRIDPENDRARLDLAENLMELGAIEPAKALLPAAPKDPELLARQDRIVKKIAFLEAGDADESKLLEAIAADPGNIDARIRLARLQASRREFETALRQLLEIVITDSKNESARKTMIDVFELAENQPELVSRYRKLLASALY